MILAYLIQTASGLPTDPSALERSISALEQGISVLESKIKILESSLPWEYWIEVFTFLVAVGVVMELRVIWLERHDEMEEWALAHFGVHWSERRPPIRKSIWGFGSVLLITVGVMGEFGVGLKIASINVRIRGESADLRDKNAELRSKSDQLVALLHEETEGIKLENTQLRAIVQPRTISLSARQTLADKLRQFAPSFKDRNVKLVSQVSDAEGVVFAREIYAILNGAGIEVDPSGVATHQWVGTVYFGAKITGPAKDAEFIKVLTYGLRAGIGSDSVDAEASEKYGETVVTVGVKPILGFPKQWLRKTPP